MGSWVFSKTKIESTLPKNTVCFQIFKYLFPKLNRAGLAGSYSLAGNNLISKPIVYWQLATMGLLYKKRMGK